MVKGYLKILVLKELSEQNYSGYSLIKELEKDFHQKPSTGSIYPLLSELQESGLIKVANKPKSKTDSKIYAITAKGRKFITNLIKEKEKLMQKNFEMITQCGDVMQDSQMKQFHSTMTSLKGQLCIRGLPLFLAIKTQLLQLVSSKDYAQKENAILKILQKTHDDLAKLLVENKQKITKKENSQEKKSRNRQSIN